MMFKILKVTGNSMHPTIESGAFVLVYRFLSPTTVDLAKPNLAKRGYVFLLNLMNFMKMPQSLKVGDIVAVNHPKYGQIVKRIQVLEYDRSEDSCSSAQMRMRLCGDNLQHSVSAKEMGWVSSEQLIGKVVYIVGK